MVSCLYYELLQSIDTDTRTQPRSFEAFESLGILDQVLERGMAIPDFRVYKMPEGVEIIKEFSGAPYTKPTPSKPYVRYINNFSSFPLIIMLCVQMNGKILGQDNLDKIIRAELEKLGCMVDLGVELLSFEQDDAEGKVHVKLARHDLTSRVARSPYDTQVDHTT